ncbi:MAG TPA: proton-conducting transporter membrane subunit, partial [Burkholderiaceae bacterium]
DQDIRNMGGLRKYMPITWITFLLGSLALIGTPFFAGFYSKENIIEAAKLSHTAGSGFAYLATLTGVFVTAFYSFRLYFLVFHGKERFDTSGHGHGHDAHGHDAHGHDDHAHDHGHDDHGHDDGHHGGVPHESPAVVWVPLVLLAIPSVIIGAIAIEPLLFGDFFKGAIFNAENHHVMEGLGEDFHGWVAYGLHSVTTLPFWLSLAGVVVAWYFYLVNPAIPAAIKARCGWLYNLLENKYYMDKFNEAVIARGARCLGSGLWKVGDRSLIDGLMVNGSARLVGWIASVVRKMQSGYIYHYAFAMIIGIMALVAFFVLLNN